MHQEGIIDLVRLESLVDQGTVNRGVYNRLRQTGAIERKDFEKFGGQSVAEQFINFDVLERMRDDGIVSIDGSLRTASDVNTRKSTASTQRWAFFIGDFFIFAAYEW